MERATTRTVKPWTKEELKELKKIYPNTSNADVALKLGRTVDCVRKQAQRMGVQKSVKYRKKCLGHKL